MTDDQTRWYHGGFPGLKRGQQILPPSVTGAISVSDKVVDAPAGMREQVGKVHSNDLVYLSQDVRDAQVWASLAVAYGGKTRGGDVYEVTPDGPLVPDPDYLPQDGKAMACSSATIARVVERRVPRPSAQDIALLGGPVMTATPTPDPAAAEVPRPRRRVARTVPGGPAVAPGPLRDAAAGGKTSSSLLPVAGRRRPGPRTPAPRRQTLLRLAVCLPPRAGDGHHRRRPGPGPEAATEPRLKGRSRPDPAAPSGARRSRPPRPPRTPPRDAERTATRGLRTGRPGHSSGRGWPSGSLRSRMVPREPSRPAAPVRRPVRPHRTRGLLRGMQGPPVPRRRIRRLRHLSRLG